MTLETYVINAAAPVTTSIIWLYGLGADCYDFADIVPHLALPTARFIFPNAPIKPITINGNMPCRAWYDIYHLDRMTHEDEQGILASQQLLTQLIENEIAKGIAPKNIILAGFSQGGAMALFTGLRYPEPLGGIVALSCYLPLMTKLQSEAHSANKDIPIFLAHGTHDNIIPEALAEMTRNSLQQMHYHVDWHSYLMAHQVSMEEIEDLKIWLHALA